MLTKFKSEYDFKICLYSINKCIRHDFNENLHRNVKMWQIYPYFRLLIFPGRSRLILCNNFCSSNSKTDYPIKNDIYEKAIDEPNNRPTLKTKSEKVYFTNYILKINKLAERKSAVTKDSPRNLNLEYLFMTDETQFKQSILSGQRSFVDLFATAILKITDTDKKLIFKRYRFVLEKFRTYNYLNVENISTINLLEICEIYLRFISCVEDKMIIEKPTRILDELYSRICTLTNQQFVALIHYSSEIGYYKLKSDRIDSEIIKRSNELNLEDIGIFCINCFKNARNIRSQKVMGIIIEKLLGVQDFGSLSSYVLSACLKCFRQNFIQDQRLMIKLTEKLSSVSVDTYPYIAWSKIANYAVSTKYYHEELNRRLIRCAMEFDYSRSNRSDPNSIRVKDVRYMMKYFCYFSSASEANRSVLEFLNEKYIYLMQIKI